MVETDVVELIDQLTEERRAAWRRGEPARELSSRIEVAWADLRRIRAEQEHGPSLDIVQRARVERELEKLMAEEA